MYAPVVEKTANEKAVLTAFFTVSVFFIRFNNGFDFFTFPECKIGKDFSANLWFFNIINVYLNIIPYKPLNNFLVFKLTSGVSYHEQRVMWLISVTFCTSVMNF